MTKNLRNEFEIFHRANPRVYELINFYASDAIRQGYKKYAIADIWENIRRDMKTSTDAEAPFNCPNNHRAYYARMWLNDNPGYPKFFRTSELRSETGGHCDRWGRPDGAEQEMAQ